MTSTITETMGKIATTLTIANRLDQDKAEDNLIPADQIRSITLKNVLVDTGRLLYACGRMRSPNSV